MDMLSIIGHGFREQLGIIGFMFLLVGIFFRLLPKWSHSKWCVEVREGLIEEAELNGEQSKVLKLRNEINAINVKLPQYGTILAVLGAAVLLFSLFVPNT